MITQRFIARFDPEFLESRYLYSFDSGGSTVQSAAEPSEFIKPRLNELLDSAQLEFQRGPKPFFPNSTVVPLSPQTEQSLQWMQNIATNGNPLVDRAQGQLGRTIQGDYLDPSINPAYQKAAQDIQGRVGGMFAASGRYGSGAMANQANEALSNIAAKAYGAERQNQLAAMQLVPQLRAAEYYDPQMLASVGQAREGQAGAQLQDQMARFQHEQGAMDESLRRYATLLQGGTVQGSTSAPHWLVR